MSRPPRPINKRALDLLSDGKARSVDEMAVELGINDAEAYEIIRSLTRSKAINVHSKVTRYGLSAFGKNRVEQANELDRRIAQRTVKVSEELRKKRDDMRKKRETERQRMENERAKALSESEPHRAIANQPALMAAWGK